MGRASDRNLTDKDKIHLQRIPLDSGGYDRGGAYWGSGLPIWCAEDSEWNRVYFRAPNRAHAKQTVVDNYCQGAKFYQ